MSSEVETPVKVEQSPVIVIPRVVFNYAVIAFVCLALGMVIGMVAYDRFTEQNSTNTEALIDKVVATAVASLPNAGGATDTTTDQNVRKTVSIDGSPSLGPKDAPITMVEFGDFHCIHCKDFHDNVIAPLLQHYGDKILYVFRNFPILGPDSLQAALAAECANDQNVFWDFHDRLFADQAELTRDQFIQDATDLKINVDQFTKCYDTSQHQDQVVKDYNDAQSLGVGGTPTFFINGKMLVGAQPYQAFAAAIDAELSSTSAAATPQAS